MSAQHASALPAATGAAVSRLAGERDVIEAARRVHRALGDTNRLEVVRRLAIGPATVSELIEFTGLSQPLVSWHLRRLRAAGLVTTERSGRESICTLRTATIAEGHALMLSALGIADPAAWIAPADALPGATPLVDAVRGDEA
jgi:DNA-binding transcriptional ArsR family regulator